MSIYGGATWRPLSENATAKIITPRLVILHTAVDSKAASSLWPYFERGTDLESSFWLPWDGRAEQYMDTTRQADANYKANPFAISVETEDDGDPNIPWTDAQLAWLIAFGFWANQVHGIPLTKATSWDGTGFGYHSQFPEKWTPYAGKTCPGPVRIAQFHDVLLPTWAKGPDPIPVTPLEDDDMDSAKNADGRIELFDVGPNRIDHAWQAYPNGPMGPFVPLGDVPGAKSVTATESTDGRIEVFAKNGYGEWFHAWQQTQNGNWSPFVKMEAP